MTNMVTVACRLPHGLVAEMGAQGESNYREVLFNGPYTSKPDGSAASLVVDGYAFTRVPEDFWKAWSEKYKNAAYMKNRMIFAEDTDEKASKATRGGETAGKTGFERLDPDKTPKGIETDKEHFQRARSAQPHRNI